MKVTLRRGPLDGAVVRGQPADTPSGLPERITCPGGHYRLLSERDRVYVWKPDKPAKGAIQ